MCVVINLLTIWASVYIAGRFVLGFGNSLSQMCSPMLLMEIAHPQHRGPLTAVYNCLWNLGSLSELQNHPQFTLRKRKTANLY